MTTINAIKPSYAYQTQPSYNAVKIEINNPQVNTQKENQEERKELNTLYNYPTASVYNVPQASVYEPQKAQAQKTAQTTAVEIPIQTSTIVPPPAVISIPKIEAPKNEEKTIEPKKVEVIRPEAMTTSLDVNTIISKLADPDYEIQANAMTNIVEVTKAAPESATELLDVKVIDTLLGILTKDTSKLEAPTSEQLKIREKILKGEAVSDAEKSTASKSTSMELAERNKQYSIYTLTILQKLYGSEIEKTTKSVVPLTELPGAAGVVEQLKSNPNPIVRATSIDALSYLQRPEYKKDLTTLFTVAQKDQSPIVQQLATMALDKLAKSEKQVSTQQNTNVKQ